jgi:hypothetical protein
MELEDLSQLYRDLNLNTLALHTGLPSYIGDEYNHRDA